MPCSSLALLSALFRGHHLPLGVLTIILAHVAFSIPLTTLVILARCSALTGRWKRRRCLGADEWTTFWRITLPLSKPGILAAALLAFPWSFNDFCHYVLCRWVARPRCPCASLDDPTGVSPSLTTLTSSVHLFQMATATGGGRLIRAGMIADVRIIE